MKTCGICQTRRKIRLSRALLLLIVAGLLVLHVIMDLKSSTDHFEMVQVPNKLTCLACQTFNNDTNQEKKEDTLIASGSEYAEPIYKEPVDLVYLWANGSDPRFILDLRRQKAIEDEEKYNSPLICKVSNTLNVSIPVIVVYPAMPLTNKMSTNDSVKLIFNVSDQEMKYTVIVPKQGKKTNKTNHLAKKTLEHMYLVNTTKYKFFNNIFVDTIFQTGVKEGKDMYALIYDNTNVLNKNKVNMAHYDFETESAILVWDPYSIGLQMEQCVNISISYTMPQKLDIELTENETEYMEPIYKDPVDLVYLWVNGSDPNFILEMKLQRALEDDNMYKSPLICNKDLAASNVNIPVIVVYPAMPQTKEIPVKFIFNVTDNELRYTVIIPKQGRKASLMMNTLIKIDGHTYICMCGYITNKVNPFAKKTLENMYLVLTPKYNFFNNFYEYIKWDNVILLTEVNNRNDTLVLLYDNRTGLPESQDMPQYDFKTESAILVWDPHSIKVTGLPTRNRFEDNDQLLYSLRSVEKYASWIRNIYIITNQQAPSWLNISNPRISVISTEEIFPNKEDLPSFSSPAIESHMHRIPELSETFLFMCDDFFFGKHVKLSDFYTVEEGLKIFWDGPMRHCAVGCAHRDLGNGKCDRMCDNLYCGWDHGDCRPIQREQIKLSHPVGHFTGSVYHTMAMFNRKYNLYKSYRIPPHVPLLVNKNVAFDLEKSFHGEFEKSSALHFRSQFNVQYTMAYYEFVTSTRTVVTTGEIFDKLDKDKSGTLSCTEFKKIGKITRSGEILCETKLQISKPMFTQCQCIIDALRRAEVTRPKYKHKLSTADRHFIRIRSNQRSARAKLFKILRQPRKFNAVNDNMDHSKKQTTLVKRDLKKFYENFFSKIVTV